jgi:small-conductance mechanosensitive channel
VVGVALGFGAQTLVRDVISGMFYLLDDAFRVGEYIQSGNYKGTVEPSACARSSCATTAAALHRAVRRARRGAEHEPRLGDRQVSIGVTYDADLEKARKLIKQIGKDLAEDPDLAATSSSRSRCRASSSSATSRSRSASR